MFARWRQENFFAYMMQHYDIDGLIEYGAENVPGTLLVVNAQWRDRDKAVRKARQTERKLQADFARRTAREGGEIHKKAELVEDIQAVQAELARLRAERKATPKKVTSRGLTPLSETLIFR